MVYPLFLSVLRVVNVEQVEREPVLRQLRVNPLGFCLRVIVNETNINPEKSTSSVLFVLIF